MRTFHSAEQIKISWRDEEPKGLQIGRADGAVGSNLPDDLSELLDLLLSVSRPVEGRPFGVKQVAGEPSYLNKSVKERNAGLVNLGQVWVATHAAKLALFFATLAIRNMKGGVR